MLLRLILNYSLIILGCTPICIGRAAVLKLRANPHKLASTAPSDNLVRSSQLQHSGTGVPSPTVTERCLACSQPGNQPQISTPESSLSSKRHVPAQGGMAYTSAKGNRILAKASKSNKKRDRTACLRNKFNRDLPLTKGVMNPEDELAEPCVSIRKSKFHKKNSHRKGVEENTRKSLSGNKEKNKEHPLMTMINKSSPVYPKVSTSFVSQVPLTVQHMKLFAPTDKERNEFNSQTIQGNYLHMTDFSKFDIRSFVKVHKFLEPDGCLKSDSSISDKISDFSIPIQSVKENKKETPTLPLMFSNENLLSKEDYFSNIFPKFDAKSFVEKYKFGETEKKESDKYYTISSCFSTPETQVRQQMNGEPALYSTIPNNAEDVRDMLQKFDANLFRKKHECRASDMKLPNVYYRTPIKSSNQDFRNDFTKLNANIISETEEYEVKPNKIPAFQYHVTPNKAKPVPDYLQNMLPKFDDKLFLKQHGYAASKNQSYRYCNHFRKPSQIPLFPQDSKNLSQTFCTIPLQKHKMSYKFYHRSPQEQFLNFSKEDLPNEFSNFNTNSHPEFNQFEVQNVELSPSTNNNDMKEQSILCFVKETENQFPKLDVNSFSKLHGYGVPTKHKSVNHKIPGNKSLHPSLKDSLKSFEDIKMKSIIDPDGFTPTNTSEYNNTHSRQSILDLLNSPKSFDADSFLDEYRFGVSDDQVPPHEYNENLGEHPIVQYYQQETSTSKNMGGYFTNSHYLLIDPMGNGVDFDTLLLLTTSVALMLSINESTSVSNSKGIYLLQNVTKLPSTKSDDANNNMVLVPCSSEASNESFSSKTKSEYGYVLANVGLLDSTNVKSEPTVTHPSVFTTKTSNGSLHFDPKLMVFKPDHDKVLDILFGRTTAVNMTPRNTQPFVISSQANNESPNLLTTPLICTLENNEKIADHLQRQLNAKNVTPSANQQFVTSSQTSNESLKSATIPIIIKPEYGKLVDIPLGGGAKYITIPDTQPFVLSSQMNNESPDTVTKAMVLNPEVGKLLNILLGGTAEYVTFAITLPFVLPSQTMEESPDSVTNSGIFKPEYRELVDILLGTAEDSNIHETQTFISTSETKETLNTESKYMTFKPEFGQIVDVLLDRTNSKVTTPIVEKLHHLKEANTKLPQTLTKPAMPCMTSSLSSSGVQVEKKHTISLQSSFPHSLVTLTSKIVIPVSFSTPSTVTTTEIPKSVKIPVATQNQNTATLKLDLTTAKTQPVEMASSSRILTFATAESTPTASEYTMPLTVVQTIHMTAATQLTTKDGLSSATVELNPTKIFEDQTTLDHTYSATNAQMRDTSSPKHLEDVQVIEQVTSMKDQTRHTYSTKGFEEVQVIDQVMNLKNPTRHMDYPKHPGYVHFLFRNTATKSQTKQTDLSKHPEDFVLNEKFTTYRPKNYWNKFFNYNFKLEELEEVTPVSVIHQPMPECVIPCLTLPDDYEQNKLFIHGHHPQETDKKKTTDCKEYEATNGIGRKCLQKSTAAPRKLKMTAAKTTNAHTLLHTRNNKQNRVMHPKY